MDFVGDGALRDIYILDTTISDWENLIKIIQEDYNPHFFVDGESTLIPIITDQIFKIRETASPKLVFKVGAISVACHFFSPREVEFDFWPKQVSSEVAFFELLQFLRKIGDSVGKRVILCYENNLARPFLTYDTGAKNFIYHE